MWLVTVIGYSANVIAGSRWRTQLTDPVHAPFTALAFVIPMMLGVTLAGQARGFGEAVFVVGLIGTVLVGGRLTGEWIVADMRLAQWHPGYFLPTVAGGLIAAGGRVPFGPGVWAAFAFSYAAAFTVAIRWLAAEHVHRQQGWTYVLLAVITAGIGALLVRTGIGLATDTFLPRLPSEAPATV